ncbi:MAG TPA: fatty acid desaturase, partial [Planctomycetota bacterium]|nr:fatty acid desaturase [Planctomycetota bacterium]
MRDGRELVRQTKPFTVERRAESWWHLLSTLTIFVAAFAIALSPLPWIPRLIAGIIAGLVHIRVFILYHDFEHGAILEGSRVAKLLLRAYGLLALAPPSIWKETHDHHHRNNARRIGIDTIGSYPILTTDEWQRASRGTRMFYRVSRHPLTIALGYLTVFMWGFCLVPLRRNPRRRLDALAALVIHFGLMAPLAFFWPAALLFGFFVPILVATALGSYLFYAQHNFPDAKLRFGEDWDY